MKQADNRPRVFSFMPTRGSGNAMAMQSHYAMPTRGAVEIVPGLAISSLLCNCFNKTWAEVLRWHKAGLFDYWCLHHDDLEIRTLGWLDIMVAEMQRTKAGVLSVVNAIKGPGGECSTAIETGSPWVPTKLMIDDLATIPATFSASETPFPDRTLLVNTGLILIDLRHPAWLKTHVDDDGQTILDFCFNIRDRIIAKKSGEYVAQVRPEDWELSRYCRANGVPVYATRLIETIHHGGGEWSNQPKIREEETKPPDNSIQGWFDFADLYRDAIRDVPDGGTLVEVGVWAGRSFTFLLNEAKKSGKTLKIIAVDHFKGSVGQGDLQFIAETSDIEKEFRANADAIGYPYTLMKCHSAVAAAQISAQQADFVFIDASHDCDSVINDIEAWLPVVIPGGRLAGHDFDEYGVRRAVTDLLPNAKRVGRCWVYDVPEIEEGHETNNQGSAKLIASN